jgi:hypothetical protein
MPLLECAVIYREYISYIKECGSDSYILPSDVVALHYYVDVYLVQSRYRFSIIGRESVT